MKGVIAEMPPVVIALILGRIEPTFHKFGICNTVARHWLNHRLDNNVTDHAIANEKDRLLKLDRTFMQSLDREMK